MLESYGYSFHVLQFTWGDSESMQGNMAACKAASIPYRCVEVWRKPVSAGAFLTVLRGQRYICNAIKEWEIDVLMPRSTLPLLSSLRALKRVPLPLVFDADGLPLDERVDFGGLSSTGFVYRALRDIESVGVRRAQVVLTRTKKAAEILHARAGAGTMESKFFRVSNGRDSEHFSLGERDERDRTRQEVGIDPNAPLIVYAGSLGGQYCLPEMLTFFKNVIARRSDARLLLLTGAPQSAFAETDKHPELHGKIVVRSVSPDEVSSFLASADLGLGLRKKSFSMQGVAPIKLGEYLLCGVPVIATSGVGDTGGLTEDIGYLVDDHDDKTLESAAVWFVEKVLADREGFRARGRELGMARYSLQASVDSYRRALEAAVGSTEIVVGNSTA
jgi:glycosyltransferase involved in cell wall biosynthesis